MADYVVPKSGVAYIFYAALPSQSNPLVMQSSPTLSAGDFKVSIDGGALANLATLPTVTPAAGKMVKFSLSAGEMTGDNITIVCSDAAGAEWCDQVFNIQTSVRGIADLSTYAGGAVASVSGNVGGVASGGITAGSFSAGAIDNAAIATDAIGSAELAASAVTEIQSGLALATDVTVIEAAIAAIQAKTVNLPSSPAAVGSAMALTVAERNSVADALLDRTDGIETGITPRQAWRLFKAALAANGTESPTGTYHVYRPDGTTVAMTVTHDAAGTRTVVIGTLS